MIGCGIGIVKETDDEPYDPEKRGRLRLIIPALTGTDSISPWMDCVYPFMEKGAISEGDQVFCIWSLGVATQLFVFPLGQIYASPDGTGSLAPGATRDDSPEVYAKTKYVEVDPAKAQRWVITIKGQPTAITIDSTSNQITLEPGPNDILVGEGGARLALEGDPVEVNTSTGIAYGRITQGSVRIQGRKIT